MVWSELSMRNPVCGLHGLSSLWGWAQKGSGLQCRTLVPARSGNQGAADWQWATDQGFKDPCAIVKIHKNTRKFQQSILYYSSALPTMSHS